MRSLIIGLVAGCRLAEVVLTLVIVIAAVPSYAGNLVCWGDNTSGMVSSVPSGSFKAVAVSACGSGNYGREFGIAIRDDGTLVGWGYNGQGQCNVPSGTFTQVSCGVTCAYGLQTDGNLVGWGLDGYGAPVDMPTLPSGETLVAVSCASSNFEYGLTSNGTAVGWGYGEGAGQVHPGTFTAIAAGDYTTIGLSPDGTIVNLRAFGTPPTGTFTTIAAGPYYDYAIRDNGTVAEWSGFYGQMSVPSGAFTAVAPGYNAAAGLRPDGTLVAWGDNVNNFGEWDVPTGRYSSVVMGGYVGVAIAAVPEPSTLVLLGIGAISLFAFARRQRSA